MLCAKGTRSTKFELMPLCKPDRLMTFLFFNRLIAQVNDSLTSNGFTPNFVLDHRIMSGGDKQEEVLGVRSYLQQNRRDAYLQQGGGYRVVSDTDTTINYGDPDNSLHKDYTTLALELGGAVWNANQFINKHPLAGERRAFTRAFTTIKTDEITGTARSCKLCTCEDDGLSGLFRCQQQFNAELCDCLAEGGTVSSEFKQSSKKAECL